NLHGLAGGSGGAVVRVGLLRDGLEDAMATLEKALAVPVLYPERLELPAAVSERYPTRLPPLRGDAPALVVGRLKDAAVKALAWRVTGSVPGRAGAVTVEGKEEGREAESDNYFLVSMAQQGQNAKDPPALLRADRALAAAYEQGRLDRLELLAEARQALQQDEVAAAARLYERARRLAPHDVEVKGGLKIVASLRSGKLSRKDLLDQLEKGDAV